MLFRSPAELSRDEKSLDHLKLKVERNQKVAGDNDANLGAMLEKSLHKSILARIDVEIVDYGTLPRTFGKSKRVIDLR